MEERKPDGGLLAPWARRLGVKEAQLRAILYLVLLGTTGLLVIQWDNLAARKGHPAGPATPVAARPPAAGAVAAGARDDLERREADMAAWLEAVLGRIEGAGRVKVMVTLESGPAQVPAMESRATTRTTQEQAQDDSKRTTTEREDQSKPVMATASGVPWVLRTDGPKVAGVLIVAEGAGSPRVAEHLSRATQTALKLLPHQVTVLPMTTGGDGR